MALNFADVASKPMAEVERPPLPPVGTYRWRITKLPEMSTTQSGEWDIVQVSVQAVEALDDVETDDYPGDIHNIRQSLRFMFNKQDEAEFEKSLFRFRTFLEKHVKVSDGLTISQAMNEAVNGEFLGSIAWKQDKDDPDLFYANIGRTAPVE
jgi:hypothetical protein